MSSSSPKPLLFNAHQQALLDAWADIYVQAHIAELLAIPLSSFLTAPRHFLDLAGQDTALTAIANGHRPLLPAQVAASQRIWNSWGNQGGATHDE
ncbi:hypothetical protein [Pseudomonas sp. BN411]|uniref:hypothetical protein n=1 Tax=Pseudomonas sp. BN411 TaxID=2567887 RepID=UPI00245606C1|nr:hypothetical protein [Pseudomonas sp. BN411]MDH4562843.1 hypothetical protein [Pseudomonas sp. BN411]